MRRKGLEKFIVVLLRFSLGWILLWSFSDKLFGLGYSTSEGEAWKDGVSPTEEFLLGVSSENPLVEVFEALAGQPWVDWVFMGGLAAIGVALILGIMMRLAGIMGACMMLLIFLAVIPAEDDPLLTYHLVYVLLFLFLAAIPSGEWFGLGKKWSRLKLVQNFPFLK